MNNISFKKKLNNLNPLLQNTPKTIKEIKYLSSFIPGESKVLDMDLLLMHTLKCSRANLYTHRDQQLSLSQIKQMRSLLALRLKGWPMAYILKEKEFFSLKFQTELGVFIPRPETETLVSAVLSYFVNQTKLGQAESTLRRSNTINIMDFGCGTGCVGLSLLTYLPYARLIGFDTNLKAIKVSYQNAKRMGLLDRAMFIHQDVSNLSPLPSHLNQTGCRPVSSGRAGSASQVSPYEKGGTFRAFSSHKEDVKHVFSNKISILRPDIIVANPPYIAFDDPRLKKEVSCFEPASALFSEEQGLAHIRAWLKTAHKLLKQGGSYFFEVGANQDLSFLKQNHYTLFKDLSGLVRVIHCQVR